MRKIFGGWMFLWVIGSIVLGGLLFALREHSPPVIMNDTAVISTINQAPLGDDPGILVGMINPVVGTTSVASAAALDSISTFSITGEVAYAPYATVVGILSPISPPLVQMTFISDAMGSFSNNIGTFIGQQTDFGRIVTTATVVSTATILLFGLAVFAFLFSTPGTSAIAVIMTFFDKKQVRLAT